MINGAVETEAVTIPPGKVTKISRCLQSAYKFRKLNAESVLTH